MLPTFYPEDMTSARLYQLSKETSLIDALFDHNLTPLLDFTIRMVATTILNNNANELLKIFGDSPLTERCVEIRKTLETSYSVGITKLEELIQELTIEAKSST